MDSGGVNWSMHELRLETARRKAAADSQHRSAENRVREARSRFERLELVCEAMWNLLKSRHRLSDDELIASVRRIDLSDGVADGRKAKAGMTCERCGRMNSVRQNQCIYCGAWLDREPFG